MLPAIVPNMLPLANIRARLQVTNRVPKDTMSLPDYPKVFRGNLAAFPA